MRAQLLALALFAAPGGAEQTPSPPEPRLWGSELGIGVSATRFETADQLWQGRRLQLRAVVRGFVVEAKAGFASVFPLGTAPFRGSAELRIGWSGRQWAAAAGL